jgi:hypothetical protein
MAGKAAVQVLLTQPNAQRSIGVAANDQMPKQQNPQFDRAIPKSQAE